MFVGQKVAFGENVSLRPKVNTLVKFQKVLQFAMLNADLEMVASLHVPVATMQC